MVIHTVGAILESFRPKQWIKNLFIFAGILFSRNIFKLGLLLKVIFAFFIFCLISSCIYIINDIIDIERDKQHPVKSLRPIASGRLKVFHAKIVLIVLMPILLALSLCFDIPFFIILLAFVLLQLSYSIILKDIIILDVFAISLGFLLRVVSGTAVINVKVSPWLLICTILLTLFLAFGKRRHELVILKEERFKHRSVLEQYTPYLLDQMLSIVGSSILITYSLYTISSETVSKFGTGNLIFTIPFVLYGVFRYLYLIHQRGGGGNPENTILTDVPLLINIFLWVLSATIIIYL